MVTKRSQITEDDRRRLAFANAKATGDRCYRRITTTTVRESLVSRLAALLDRRSSTSLRRGPTPVRTHYQAGVTFSACGPLGPWVMSKLTCWFSSKLLK